MDFGNLPYSEGTKHQVTSASVNGEFFFFFNASFASSRTNSGCDSWQPTGEVMLRRTEQGREVATLSSSPLILNFMCQFGGTKGCPDSWYTLFQAVSVMLFPKEIISS